MKSIVLHLGPDGRPAERRFAVELLAGPALASAEMDCMEAGNDQWQGLTIAGTRAVSCYELDDIFAAVTLRREIETRQLDRHGRFDESQISWDISRPWVDLRAVELLGHAGSATPRSSAGPRFRVVITHDVDRTTGLEPMMLVKSVVGQLRLKPAWTPKPGVLQPKRWLQNLARLLEFEQDNGIGALYFLLSGPYGLRRYSSRYGIRWSQSREVVRLILEAGMRVGLHGSYYARDRNSYGDELRRLEDVVGMTVTCHRNHYLRFDPRSAWHQLENAGISHDFSIGFNYRVGFRTGCASAHSTFDLSQGRKSSVVSVPLLFMDNVTAVGSSTHALAELERALEDVRRVSGCVALLFHPENFLGDEKSFAFFRQVVRKCKDMGADLSEMDHPSLPGAPASERMQLCE